MLDITLKKSNILIVDDKMENIEVLQGLLEVRGYENVKATTDPRQVAGLFQAFQPDILLLDLMMPHLNGYQVMEQLKELIPPDTYFPILMLTADVAEETKRRALAQGAKDFLTKPFDLIEVELRIRNLLETRYLYLQVQNQNVILEEKVKQRTAQLEEANANLAVALSDIHNLDLAKTDFLHMASHEIRTPLNGILGGVQLLKMSELSDEILEYLNILDQSTLRLEKFSKQALEISHLQTRGASLFYKVQFSFPEFLKTFVQEYIENNDLASRKIQIASTGKDIQLFADPNYLRKTLEILVDNAILYAPDESFVAIGLKEDQENVICNIEDQGSGFPENMLIKSLLQFNPGIEHQDQRSGLNLHLANIILHFHQGEFLLSNNDAGGATVTLKFPKIAKN